MENKEIAVVTGANGFVGSHLVDLLVDKGYNVRCIVRGTSDLKWLKNHLEEKKVELFTCGLNNKEELVPILKDAHYIYHVAGVVKSKKPEGYFSGNVEPARNILDVAEKHCTNLKRILVVSSQTAAGPSLDGIPINEEMRCNPITTYGRSKLNEEKVTITYRNILPVTICRAPAVYGERDTEIFIFFKTFASGLFTTIGFNTKLISLIHVSDLVNGFYLAATSEKAKGQIYFISSERLYTWEEIGEVTSRVLNKKAFHIRVPHTVVFLIAVIAEFLALFSKKASTLNVEKAKDITQTYWVCSTQKAMNDFGYKQKISIEEGIERTIKWYKQIGWLK